MKRLHVLACTLLTSILVAFALFVPAPALAHSVDTQPTDNDVLGFLQSFSNNLGDGETLAAYSQMTIEYAQGNSFDNFGQQTHDYAAHQGVVENQVSDQQSGNTPIWVGTIDWTQSGGSIVQEQLVVVQELGQLKVSSLTGNTSENLPSASDAGSAGNPSASPDQKAAVVNFCNYLIGFDPQDAYTTYTSSAYQSANSEPQFEEQMNAVAGGNILNSEAIEGILPQLDGSSLVVIEWGIMSNDGANTDAIQVVSVVQDPNSGSWVVDALNSSLPN